MPQERYESFRGFLCDVGNESQRSDNNRRDQHTRNVLVDRELQQPLRDNLESLQHVSNMRWIKW